MNATRQRILDASTDRFRRQGFNGTGLKQLLEDANAPYGSLYHHFPGGKNQLAEETLRQAGAEYAELVTAVLIDGPDIAANVRRAFELAGETLGATDFIDACPIETVALEVASTNEPLRIVTAEIFAGWIDQLTELLHTRGLGLDDAHSLAQVILSSLEGAFVLSRSSRTTDALDACGVAMGNLVTAALT